MNIESIIQNLSSPVTNKTLRNINHSVSDILTNTSCDRYYQTKVCESFLETLKKLNLDKKYKELHTILNIFNEQQLIDILFLKWLSQKLKMRTQRFIETVKNWHTRGCEETQGRKNLSDEIRQSVYDIWVEQSVNSTDGRNGRNTVKITKL